MKVSTFLFYIIIILCLFFSLACSNEEDTSGDQVIIPQVNKKELAQDTLYVLATADFFQKNLIDSLSSAFLIENKSLTIWENGGNGKEIINLIAKKKYNNNPDLVLGISNVFLTELDSLDVFKKLDEVYFSKVRKNNRFDKKKRFLPYQYSYLALLKKNKNKDVLPFSFGIMQKEEFFNKIIVLDAENLEYGRALFNNIEGVFKYHGYASCWNRIKGSIYSIEDSSEEAWKKFWDLDDKFIFYPVTQVASGFEKGYEPTIDYTYMSEGSYQLFHASAIFKQARNREKAEVFLLWLHKPETQAMIVKTTNWFPIVEHAEKSRGHTIIDVPNVVMNSKIDQRVVNKYLDQWLDFWKYYKKRF